MRRLLVLLIVGLTCILVAAASAYGKGDVRAILENPAQLQRAAPGQRIKIVWRLTEASQSPSLTMPGGAAAREFSASGVYVRVRGAAGTTPKTFAATSALGAGSQSGRYVADVTAPTSGITAIAIGLEGCSGLPGQAATRADVFFPIANDPFTVANTPVTATSSDAGATAPWLPLVAVFAGLGVLLAGYRTVATRRAAT